MTQNADDKSLDGTEDASQKGDSGKRHSYFSIKRPCLLFLMLCLLFLMCIVLPICWRPQAWTCFGRTHGGNDAEIVLFRKWQCNAENCVKLNSLRLQMKEEAATGNVMVYSANEDILLIVPYAFFLLSVLVVFFKLLYAELKARERRGKKREMLFLYKELSKGLGTEKEMLKSNNAREIKIISVEKARNGLIRKTMEKISDFY